MATDEMAIQPETRSVRTLGDNLHCITQDSNELAPQDFRDVCDDNPIHIACSVHCPIGEGECGGHPICDPCFRLGIEYGLIREGSI